MPLKRETNNLISDGGPRTFYFFSHTHVTMIQKDIARRLSRTFLNAAKLFLGQEAGAWISLVVAKYWLIYTSKGKYSTNLNIIYLSS